MPDVDAVVVGAGPNGLAAAIELARAGKTVLVCEAKDTVGGGARTMELTLPGYLHDVCSAIHPLGLASPFFKTLPLNQYGVEWIHPDIALAHPFPDGSAAKLVQSMDDMVASLDKRDERTYRSLMQPFSERWDDLATDILGPLRIPPKHPFLMARFGLKALRSATGLARSLFKSSKTQALFAGMCAHSILPLEWFATASFGMVLGILGHAVGWPIPKGGSQTLVNAMASYLQSLGGKIVTGSPVDDINALPSSHTILLDLTPRQLLRIVGERLSPRYKSQLQQYRYGPGVFKMDWALSGSIPWTAPECHRAGTIHIGPELEDIALSERLIWKGEHQKTPFVIVAQQSIFDPSRAPSGHHTGWAYCHVPHGSTVDMSERILNQVERFAPGFRDLIIETHTMTTSDMTAYNPNYIGGDINGGAQDIRQLFTRPVVRLVPYKTSTRGIYICSSSTPPGGGVHGMCGYHAAKVALREMF